ncbi:MAG: long-chain acyl-CoA synthetase [Azoarcus sp.]|uniref:Long-chain acyl-CoA synthetase n=1 Tax=Aromatoleum tolulyticum TaxID=34027 RepID=A0A1N6XKM9_9RHOO|nr:AMP-binding protein [Aromatoleum tolulyticum]MCK9986344.1 long-chain acyl-CoA synthetase [Azoarcus sp.]SIR02905.1 long-chain acyl-CoA synthetase [Aromatoleum tolulyticum]
MKRPSSATIGGATAVERAAPRSVRALLERQALERPDATYAICPETGRELSFGRLARASLSLAALLASQGLAAGDRVGLFLPNGLQALRLFVGTMAAGCVATPLSLLAQPQQLAYVLEHSDCRVVFVAPGQRATLEDALARIGRHIAVVVVDPDDDAVPGEDAAAAGAVWPLTEPLRDGEALMMYTSGTTGRPKGAVLSQRNVLAGARFVSDAHELGPADRVLAVLPLYHINAQIVTALAPLLHGGSLVLPRRFSVGAFWGLAEEYRCTWLNVVPTMIAYLLDAPDRTTAPAGVRFCRSASAPLAPELHRAFEARFGIGVIETMGLTETAAPVFSNPLDPARRRIGSPGRAFGCEARVVDPATGRPVRDGVPGEIQIRGDNVMLGYYKAPDETAKGLGDDGWLRTGDLGYRDADGFYFITGRLKELIIKGGENIAPREIDEALLRHPGVLEAAAVGVPDPAYGQEIEAAVVLRPGASSSEAELQGFCRVELGPFKTPRAIRIVQALPKGPSGKVQRLKLLDGVTA